MGIFHRRPLFLWCAAFAATAAGGYILCRVPGVSLVSLWIISGCMFGVALLFGGGLTIFLGRRRGKQTALTMAFTILAMLLGLFQSVSTFAGKTASAVRAWIDTEVTVEAVVLERRGTGGNLSAFALVLEEVNGQECEDMAVLTCHYLADLSPGDMVTLTARAITLEESAGEGYSAGALRGDGFVVGLLSESEADMEITGEADAHGQVRMGNVRRTLAARLNLLTGKDAKGLPSALLLGDKSALDDRVRRDFARSGVSHLLAISGLHMTLLFGLLDGILRLFRLSKRWRAVLLGTAAGAYLMGTSKN